MSVLAALRADVTEQFRHASATALLWLDPGHEWERLLDQIAGEFELLKYSGSQLELRAKLERSPATKPRVVYVPLARSALSVLKEYEFILPVWDEDLLHALRRWGVEIDREGALGVFRDFLAEAYGVSDDAASPGRIARLSVSGSFARSERPGEMPSVSRPVARIPLAGPVRCTIAARCRARPRPGDRCGDRTACRGRFRRESA